MVERALAGRGRGRLDAVAFTRGPGLMGPLLIGKVAGQTLARLLGVPAIGVNHLEGHVLAAELEHELRWPLVALVVSGGHTDLVLVSKPGRYRVLGRTRDDAAGEAYDKVALVRPWISRWPGDRPLGGKGRPSRRCVPSPGYGRHLELPVSGLKTSVSICATIPGR